MTAKVPSGPGLGCDSQLDLYWILLGAGQHVVRTSGAIYEACAAALQRRPRSPLYHSALVAELQDVHGDGAAAPATQRSSFSRP